MVPDSWLGLEASGKGAEEILAYELEAKAVVSTPSPTYLSAMTFRKISAPSLSLSYPTSAASKGFMLTRTRQVHNRSHSYPVTSCVAIGTPILSLPQEYLDACPPPILQNREGPWHHLLCQPGCTLPSFLFFSFSV